MHIHGTGVGTCICVMVHTWQGPGRATSAAFMSGAQYRTCLAGGKRLARLVLPL
jgi:hypothetical protein